MTLDRIAPALFVLLWSTGWIVAKYASPHADPLTFLSMRFTLAAVLFGVITFVSRAAWPSTRAGWGHAVLSGVFLHGIYLGGVWWAISQGVPSSVSGLIAALQPLLTALAAPFIVGERLTGPQRLGVVLGFAGLSVAILPRLLALDVDMLQIALVPLLVNVFAMASVTAGTIYQKRYLQEGDLRAIAAVDRADADRLEHRICAGHGLVGAGSVAGLDHAAVVPDPSRSGIPRRIADLSGAACGCD